MLYKTVFLVALGTVLCFGSAHSQECPDPSIHDPKGRGPFLYRPDYFYVDLFTTPHLQFLSVESPKVAVDMAYGASFGRKFINGFAFDVGVDLYGTNRQFQEFDDPPYKVDILFLEGNIQLKYYIEKDVRWSFYQILGATINFATHRTPLSLTDYEFEGTYLHNWYASFGVGTQRRLTPLMTAYFEPTFRFPVVSGWSYITYQSSSRMTFGLRVFI